jgi:hypothetical protein
MAKWRKTKWFKGKKKVVLFNRFGFSRKMGERTDFYRKSRGSRSMRSWPMGYEPR